MVLLYVKIMKNIMRILRSDLKNIARNIIVFVVVIGICILPALYAWFNIASNWDPYSSTGGIPFAVCSKDKGYSYKVLSINAGNTILDNLKQNDKMGWTFVSEKEAIEGVKNGTYYAAVIIPEDFSESLFSVTTGNFHQAKLEYYLNEKKNAIAPKITDKGAQAVQESVNTAYVSTITKVIATTLNLSTDDISKSKVSAAEKITESLESTKKDLDTFEKTVDIFISTFDTIDGIIKTNKEALPAVQEKLKDASVVPKDIKQTIKGAQATSKNLTDSISAIIETADQFSDSLSAKVESAFSEIEKDSKTAAEKLSETTTICERIISINNRLIEILQTAQDNFGIDCSSLIDKLNNANGRQTDIISAINSGTETITKTGALPKNVQDDIRRLISSVSPQFDTIKTSFESIRSGIDSAIESGYSALDKVSDILLNLSGDIPGVESTLDNISETNQSMKTTFVNLKSFVESAKTKIDDMIKKVDEIKNNNTIENLVTPIIRNPNALGDFISSPVDIKTTSFFPIENYGSAMTPFYSSLAFWVGGIVLVAVMKCDLTRKELKKLNNPTQTQLFFGRYLIFFLLGQLQSLIITLGDIFFLKVQVNDPVIFVLSGMLSSFIYTLIIYSLTISFSTIGKALAVIILVIQIAGAGGTFPIEVLPEPFQAVSPILPFKYGVNLLREGVAGVDYNVYMINMLCMLVFIPVALILGLLLRRPCIKLISFFNMRVEESDIII